MIAYINESNQICTQEEFLLEKKTEEEKAASKEAKLAAKLEKKKAKDAKKSRNEIVLEIKNALKAFAKEKAQEYKTLSKQQKLDLPEDKHEMYLCMKDIHFMVKSKKTFLAGENNDIYYRVGSKARGTAIGLAIGLSPVISGHVAASQADRSIRNTGALKKLERELVSFIKKEYGYNVSMTIKTHPAILKITVNNA